MGAIISLQLIIISDMIPSSPALLPFLREDIAFKTYVRENSLSSCSILLSTSSI